MEIDGEDIVIVVFVIGVIIAVGSITYAFVHVSCMIHSEKEHQIINVTDEDIIIKNDNFYINGPNDKLVEIDLDKGSVFDISKQSVVYLRFTRDLPYFLYEGSDWRVDGIVKAPGGD